VIAFYAIWLSELEASVPWLIFGVTVLVMQCAVAPFRWRRARRSVRRMRAAAARGH
jgi:hypothetical protein